MSKDITLIALRHAAALAEMERDRTRRLAHQTSAAAARAERDYAEACRRLYALEDAA